ncbi:MAG TPA: hypothetical protein VNL13_01680 [Sulfolobales archaeon]|nr:hypothetical protein [Sulfolobales archaeon]
MCILYAIGIIASLAVGFYAELDPEAAQVHMVHMVVGVLNIFLLGYLVYVALTQGNTYTKILSPAVFTLNTLLVLMGLEVFPGSSVAHPYIVTALIALSAIAGYMGFISSRARRKQTVSEPFPR